jgi:hypothetical protein
MKALVLLVLGFISLCGDGFGNIVEISSEETKTHMYYELELTYKGKVEDTTINEYRQHFGELFRERVTQYVADIVPTVMITKTLMSEGEYITRTIEIKVAPTSVNRISDKIEDGVYVALYKVTVDKKDSKKALDMSAKLIDNKEAHFKDVPELVYNNMLAENHNNGKNVPISIQNKGEGFIYSKYNKLGKHCYDRYKKGVKGMGCTYKQVYQTGLFSAPKTIVQDCGLDERLERLHGIPEPLISIKSEKPKECYY